MYVCMYVCIYVCLYIPVPGNIPSLYSRKCTVVEKGMVKYRDKSAKENGDETKTPARLFESEGCSVNHEREIWCSVLVGACVTHNDCQRCNNAETT
jgi:hypothetical protein